MMSQSRILAFLIIFTTCGQSFAHVQTRLGAVMTWEENSKKSSMGDMEEENLSLGGIQLELLGHNLGYGCDALVNFRQDPLEQWYLDWQGQLFLRYHLWGSENFLDPFIEAGYGNAGSVSLEDSEDNQLKLSLFPSFSTGLNLLFHEGLIIGGRLTYRPMTLAIPTTDIEKAAIGRCQASLIIGLALGTSRPHKRRNDYYDDYFDRY